MTITTNAGGHRIRSIYFHIHLVSDSTGETLVGISRASCAQYQHGLAVEHLHALVRSEQQLEKALISIRGFPGVVFYTLVNQKRRRRLEQKCAELNIPAVSVLDPSLATLGRYLGAPMSSEVGAQRTMDAEYFSRMGALDFAMTHDDGQNIDGLVEADIILLGVSRTSKTPTCIYLANRGFKTGNIPLVPGTNLPDHIMCLSKPLIVGLVSSPDRIVQIRRNRLTSLGDKPDTDYVDKQKVRSEMMQAKRLFAKHKWPIVDVTRRSIEETSARIINLFQDRSSQ
ncbi:MAG: phosphoenolpyruvate synthase regulatory protein [Robiginitomaculum sp.]|nr:MAG: phosphoenolpyruvate synthase regulatory protein [Robiginitomaculum sp.]